MTISSWFVFDFLKELVSLTKDCCKQHEIKGELLNYSGTFKMY